MWPVKRVARHPSKVPFFWHGRSRMAAIHRSCRPSQARSTCHHVTAALRASPVDRDHRSCGGSGLFMTLRDCRARCLSVPPLTTSLAFACQLHPPKRRPCQEEDRSTPRRPLFGPPTIRLASAGHGDKATQASGPIPGGFTRRNDDTRYGTLHLDFDGSQRNRTILTLQPWDRQKKKQKKKTKNKKKQQNNVATQNANQWITSHF